MDDSATQNLKIEHAPQTLREMALERTRRAIFSGHFKMGERLVERSLCEQLGVSRSVVREVIRYLEAEGLVECLRNKGPIVARLNWDQAKQIYDIRLLLEQKAAMVCAENADSTIKSKLEEAMNGLDLAFEIADPNAILDATTVFYEIIFRSAGHDIALGIVQRLHGRISWLRALTLSSTNRHVSGPARLRAIHNAIVANDPNAAAKAVHEHIQEASALACTALIPKEDLVRG